MSRASGSSVPISPTYRLSSATISPMLTVGLDVASQPRGTAACWVEWKHREAHIGRIAQRVTDDDIRSIVAEQADKTGIDVPLGWPDAFAKALARHHRGEPWGDHASKTLELRATDRQVHEATGRWPLSVSTDRIAYPAMRIARLLAGIDRTGDGPIVEVYPAAALRMWDLAAAKYKGTAGSAALPALIAALRAAAPWLGASDDQWVCLERNDDAFDALIASLVARAKAARLCQAIPDRCRELAAVEGWIALPETGSLPRLADRVRDHHLPVSRGT